MSRQEADAWLYTCAMRRMIHTLATYYTIAEARTDESTGNTPRPAHAA